MSWRLSQRPLAAEIVGRVSGWSLYILREGEHVQEGAGGAPGVPAPPSPGLPNPERRAGA